jgi:hypothetical protein
MKQSVVVFLVSVVLCSCATQKPTTETASAQRSGELQSSEAELAKMDALSKQTDNPQMIDYFNEVCRQPQPKRAQLGNELIRTHHLKVLAFFDAENPMNLEGTGQTVTVPFECPPTAAAANAPTGQ